MSGRIATELVTIAMVVVISMQMVLTYLIRALSHPHVTNLYKAISFNHYQYQ
jgi:hypothetical protein